MMKSKYIKYSLYMTAMLAVLFPPGAFLMVLGILMLALMQNKGGFMRDSLLKDKPLCIFVFCILLSTVFSQIRAFSLLANLLLIIYMILFLSLRTEIKITKVDRFFNILNWACILSCLYGIYQFASGDMEMMKSWVDRGVYGDLVRVYGTLYNPNVFAGYLMLHLCFALGKFESFRKNKPLTLSIVLAPICLVLTASRGGFAAFLAAGIGLWVMKKDKRIPIYLLAVTALFYLYSTIAAEGVSRASLLHVSQDSSSLYRLEIWKSGIGIFLDNMIFGSGVGTIWYTLAHGSDKLYRYVLHAHNIYIQIAAELGMAGLAAFAYMIWAEFKNAYKAWKQYGMRGKAGGFAFAGFDAALIGALVHGLVDAVIVLPYLTLIYIVYMGLYKAVYDETMRKHETIELKTYKDTKKREIA